MSELSKQALRVENNTQFPNNNSGYITPSRLRGFNSDMIDSTVNQAQYEIDSASWNNQINALDPSGSAASITALNQFTGSQEQKNAALASQSGSWVTSAITASSLVNASATLNVITFTKGDNTTFNVTVNTGSGGGGATDITSLNAYTASQDTKNATLAVYTASVNQQLTSLASTTASLNTSVTNLNLFTSSQNTKNATLATYTGSNDTKWSNLGSQSGSWITETESGSFLITASFASQTLTFTKGNGTQFSVVIPDNSGSVTDLTSLNAFTASQDTKNATLASVTASLISETTNLELFTASANSRLNNLEAATSSYVTANITGSSLVTASIAGQVITFTKGNNTTFGITLPSGSVPTDITALNQFTASQESKNNTLASYTASNDAKWNNLASQSGSWITESETGSFARYDVSNPWSADQTFTNITAVSASFQYVKTVFETASVIFSSGSNQFGDAADDVQTLYGSVRVMNQLTASGLNYPTADNGAKSFMQTDGAGNLSLKYVDTIWETIYAGASVPKGTPLYISGSQGANPIVYPADASDPNKMPVTFIAGDNYTINNSYPATVLGLIEGIDLTGYTVGQTVYAAEGGGWTTNLPSGSNSITQVLGVVTKAGNGGKGLVLNPGPAQLPGLQTGYVWVGNGVNQPVAVLTSSLVTTPTDISALNAFTASADNRLDNLEAATSSYAISSSVAAVDAAQQSQIDALIAITGSFLTSSTDISSLNAFTASQQLLNTTFATTGSNIFKGNQSLSGSILISGSTLNVVSGSDNGNVITNLGDTYTDLPQVQTIVTLSDTEYAALVAANETNDNTLYIVSGSAAGVGYATLGSNEFNGNQVISGSITLYSAGEDAVVIDNDSGFFRIAAPVNAVNGINIPGDQIQITLQNNADSGINTIFENIDNVGLRIRNNGSTGVIEIADNSLNISNGTFTASLQEGYIWVGDSAGKTYEFSTASLAGGGTDITELNAFTASQESINNGYNSFTASQELLNTTFATTGSNTFTGTQNIISSSFSGSLISNLTDIYTDIPAVDRIVTLTSASYAALLSGSLTDANTLYVISGSTTSGGGATDITALNDFTASQYVSNSFFATTGSNSFYGNQIIYDAAGGFPITLSANAGTSQFEIGGGQIRPQSGLIIPGDQNQIVLINDANADYNTNIQNIDNVGVRFQSDVATDAIMELAGYSLNVANTLTASISEGYVWVGDSVGRTYEVATSSFGTGGTIDTASFATTGSNIFTGTQNIVSQSFSGSLISNLTDIYTDIPAVDRIVTLTSASYAALLSGSLTDANTLYVISGSATTGGGTTDITALNAFTASQESINTNLNAFTASQDLLNTTFATTGSNEFQANQIITGSLILASVGNPEGFVTTITSDDTLGRFTINQTIQADSGIYMANNEALVFIDSIDTDWNARLVQVDGEGLRLSNEGTISGPTLRLDQYNLVITGSARGIVSDITITDSTASLDLAGGNYFTLTLAASATTHITATNIQPGQTVTLLVNTNASSNAAFSPTILQPSGSTYTPSPSGSKDIISLVAFDDTTLYAVSTKNLI